MHYIPHQRSLPPIPTTSHPMSSHAWQRSSLPARSRPHSPVHSTWQRTSLQTHARQRPASYLEPDTRSTKGLFNHIPTHSSTTVYDPSRSRSTLNLYDVSPFDPYMRHSHERDRYSTDDLTSLHSRSQFHSLDRRYARMRASYHDVNEYSNRYDPNPFDIEFRSRRPYHNRYSRHIDRFEDDEPYVNTHYDSYKSLSRSANAIHAQHHNVSPFYVQRSYTPRSISKHSSPDEVRSNVSVPASMRSKAGSVRRTSPHDRNSISSRISMRKEYSYQESQSYHETSSQILGPDYSQDTKYVYLKQPTPQHCTQVLATLVVSLGPLCAGLGKGYSSPALASMATLSAKGHHFSISKDQGSWVASLSLLGAFFGSLPAGMSINWGRKRVLCIVAIPFALSWILTVVATNVYMLYIAAILGGICTAIISVVTPVYISEIAHPEIRGCLCAFSKLNSNVGMLISYLLGAFMNWRQLATVTAIAPTCLFVSSLFIPETPSFLLYRGRDTEAIESLKWLRGSSNDVSRELAIMKANITTLRREQQEEKQKTSHSFAPRELIRPLFITCGLMVFQKFSGANAFNFYAVPILSETFVGLNPYRAAVVVAFVQICAGMASSALVDTVGRRPLLVFSNMLMAAALAAFGCYVYVKGLHQNEDIFSRQEWRESDWVPLFCILVIEIAYALGVSPISWLYIGELFPLKHRGFGALAASVSYVCSFASVKTFVDLQTWLGLYGAFWFYATIAAIALVFTLLFVPETKGKSLQEMQVLEQQKETLI